VIVQVMLKGFIAFCVAPVQAFDHPSINSIAGFLSESQLLPAAPAATSAHSAALQLVTTAVHDLLGLEGSSSLDPSAPLMSAGLNSTMAVTLASAIEAAVGSPVPATLVSIPCLPACLLFATMYMMAGFLYS